MKKIAKIYAIGLNSFRESIRDKILYVLVVFGLALIVSSLLAGSISLGQDKKIIIDFGLSSIAMFGLLISVFSGANLVHKEIDKKTIYFLFSKPISPAELVLGKFFGLASTLFLIYILFTIIFFGLIRWKIGEINWLILEAIGLNYFENLIIISLVLIFSGFTAPLSSAVYTILIYLIGHSTQLIQTLIKQATNNILKFAYEFAYYVFPNLEKFNVRNDVFYGNGIEPIQAIFVIGYGLVYIIIALILTTTILKKREY